MKVVETTTSRTDPAARSDALPGDGAPLRPRERRGGVGGAEQLLEVLHQRQLLLRRRPREHQRARHT